MLADGAKLGGWWQDATESGRIICQLCPRECVLRPGDRGFCFVRENRDGQMVLATYGRSTGFCIDPIEKKPLNHFYPGTSVLSFGTAGCNLGCKFCQNWSISKSREVRQLSEEAMPEAIASAASRLGCRSVAFTYNDPVIWAEYALDVAEACRAVGVKTVAVTAGYITTEARGAFFEGMDAANVDLKAFTEQFYHRLTLSHLQPVLDTLKWLCRDTDVWIELTNLIIPDANDSLDELQRMCAWVLEELGDQIPVHFTAFHPDFRMRDRPRTPRETLLEAYDIARRTGLKYVYLGNVNDVGRQSTYCPGCGQLVIQRDWHQLGAYRMTSNRCGHCGETIAGFFDPEPGDWGGKRQPVRISDFAGGPSNVRASHKGGSPMSTTNRPSVSNDPPPGQPQLTPEQKKGILRAASEVVACAVTGRTPVLSDPAIAGAAEQKVLGCFLTIKRHGRLRGCCGFLGRESTVSAGLTEASIASATRDVRMPSVSASELEYLDLTVSFLHSFRPMVAKGEDRVQQVEVGRHGLQIAQGASRGLLLPSVAVEHNMDARQFLQQVCLKAGLPATAWKEDDAQLVTFESETFGGDFDKSALGGGEVNTPSLFGEGQIQQLAQACRDNIVAVMRGATPTYYLPNCPDGTVQGITLTLAIAGKEDATRLTQLSLRPGFPLQATLLELAKRAAQGLSAERVFPEALAGLRLELAVAYDPAMHGSVANPHLDGIDPADRAVLVLEGERSALVFDPQQNSQQLLKTASEQAQVRSPDNASVISLRIESTETPMIVAAVPRAQAGPKQRPTAVAGSFYPGDAKELSRMIDQLVSSEPAGAKESWPAAMVPHAGLQYSGKLAASVLQKIDIPGSVIVVCPKHTRMGVEWAVAPHDQWSLPGTTLASDPDLARQLAESITDLQLDAAAHAREHAIEVELPLLARLAPETRVVGIAIGGGDLDRCRQFATELADVLRGMEPPPLLVISSDMNHYASDTETRRVDELVLDSIRNLDPEQVYQTVRKNQVSMCGVLPTVIVMETLRQLGRLNKCETVGYSTSADVSGDTSRVVGYAGLLFG